MRQLVAKVVAGYRYVWPVALERSLPVRGAVRRVAADRRVSDRPVTVLSVYRLRNAHIMQSMVARNPGVDFRLWALDEESPDLADRTLGCGPGPKFALVNRLYASRPVPDDAWVVVADDDVVFASGSLGEAAGIAERRHLDLWQPAHSWASIFTYPMLLHRPWLEARRTGFVESGPLWAVSPAWRTRVLPLPEDLDMGWGIEVSWHRLRKEGCALGVIDACPVMHLDPVGKTYNTKQAKAVLVSALADEGYGSIYDLMKVDQRWPARS